MKKIILFVALLAACGPTVEKDPHHPKRPAAIPETTCDGTPIEWNWEKQRAYDRGRLFVERDSSGCVLVIIRKIR